YVRVRDARKAGPSPAPAAAEPKRKEAKPRKAPPPKRKSPNELERVESAIAARERTIADLETRLADDWSDVDTVAAHRRARDELQELLGRWETLFEGQQA
ncbi:MAG: hypothetical protein QOE36_1351, partial [Gaiellaceae bacterium]|nr:hypothetical protein [Gaiellaceae bacterium]